jgi:hypothetical protein
VADCLANLQCAHTMHIDCAAEDVSYAVSYAAGWCLGQVVATWRVSAVSDSRLCLACPAMCTLPVSLQHLTPLV